MDKKSLLAIGIITVVILLLPSYYDLIYDKPATENIIPPQGTRVEQPVQNTEPAVTEKPSKSPVAESRTENGSC